MVHDTPLMLVLKNVLLDFCDYFDGAHYGGNESESVVVCCLPPKFWQEKQEFDKFTRDLKNRIAICLLFIRRHKSIDFTTSTSTSSQNSNTSDQRTTVLDMAMAKQAKYKAKLVTQEQLVLWRKQESELQEKIIAIANKEDGDEDDSDED